MEPMGMLVCLLKSRERQVELVMVTTVSVLET